MTTSTADVRTDRPGRYGKQLVSHLSRHSVGEWSDESQSGSISFDAGRATLRSSDGVLHLEVEGDDIARLEDVVGRHLVRFGAKDELVVQWTRDDGAAGTQQRNDG